ncbi:MAG TPA: hypothetical protein ENI85_13065 [Deltaproteobacteria bacterium]|nr:hypothetical protein [Deltaproteobacteria bacterium]
MTLHDFFRSFLVASTTVLLITLAGAAQAQQVDEIADTGRDDIQLQADMTDAIERNVVVANTALVFTNAGRHDTLVVCVGYDANGNVLGRRAAKVPSQGVRYLRASDFSGGADFVGSALCKARGHVIPSAVFLAPGAITHLDVRSTKGKRATRVRFPLIATY